MTYGLGTRARIESGSVGKADGSGVERSWSGLSEEARLALVEQAVRAANDRFDAYPLAL